HPRTSLRTLPGMFTRTVAECLCRLSLRALPAFLIPKRLQTLVPGAAGSNSHSVWRMGEGPFVAGAMAERLQFRPDPQNSSHGFIEPSERMSLTEYQLALHATQDEWSVDEE